MYFFDSGAGGRSPRNLSGNHPITMHAFTNVIDPLSNTVFVTNVLSMLPSGPSGHEHEGVKCFDDCKAN